ncbi:MAG: hypothetical protein AAFX95_21895 [Cyanobacteria bacterium J06639_16]
MSQSFTLPKAPPWCSATASSQDLLAAVAQTWEDTPTSEHYLQQALAQPQVELDVLIGAYRYYFYKNRDAMALQMAMLVLDRIQQAEQWPTAWDDLKPILLERIDDSNARLYLNAYAASGLLLARLGNFEEAQSVADQVQQIEAKEFGAEVLHSILNPAPEEEED